MAVEGSFKVANNAAIRVKCGKTDEMLIKGLQSIKLPIGFTMDTTKVSVMGQRIDTTIPTGGSYEEISSDYLLAAKSPSQAYLQQSSLNSTEIRDMRFYLDDTIAGDFATVDLISDPVANYRVGTFSSPGASKGELVKGTMSILPGGASAFFAYHASGVGLEFAIEVGGATITNSIGDFVEEGFAVGMTGIIDHLGDLDPLFVKIKSVTTTVITLEDGIGDEAKVTTETGGATTAFHAAVPMIVANV